MESEFDTTGVITKILDESSIVSVTINDVSKLFFFSKYLLYVFGLQCEGQMDNILDEGMEVSVRFKLSNEKVPYVVAVWIGEKPDHLCNDSALKSFYEQKGKVISMDDDNIRAQVGSSDYTILISREVFFRDGHDLALIAGETVTFDGIPTGESGHPTGDSYQATCAWIGPSPTLVERFGLGIVGLDDPPDFEDTRTLVHGTVAVIPNEAVAFAEMKCDQPNGKVLLFRSSFAIGPHNIKNVIGIGDSVCMWIRFKYRFDGTKQLYASQAWKDGGEVFLNELLPRVESIEGNLPEVGTVKVDVATEEGLIVNSDGISSGKGAGTFRKKGPRRRGQGRIAVVATQGFSNEPPSTREHSLESDSKKASLPAESGKPKQKKRDVLVNDPPLSGIIRIISEDFAFIVHNELKILIDRRRIFIDGKPLTDDRDYLALVWPGDQEVFFEAVKRNAENKNKDEFSYDATSVWVGKKPLGTSVLNDNAPETGMKANMYPSQLLETRSAAIEFDESASVLIGVPPLSGHIALVSRTTAAISYQRLCILVNWMNMYVDGKACSERAFRLTITNDNRKVNFEAIRLKDKVWSGGHGFTHEATLAWYGRRPGYSVDAEKPVLYREDFPLEGVLTYTASNIYIRYEDLKVFLDTCLTYDNGKPMSTSTISDMASNSSSIKFEAVKSSDPIKISNGYSHEATCAWVGQRPKLGEITRTLPQMDFNLLRDKDRSYSGVVRRFCLPKVALVCASQPITTVILHVSAFGCKPRRNLKYYESGKDCISSCVKLNDIVEFKIAQIPRLPNVLFAIDVKVVNIRETSISGDGNISAGDVATAGGTSVVSKIDALTEDALIKEVEEACWLRAVEDAQDISSTIEEEHRFKDIICLVQ